MVKQALVVYRGNVQGVGFRYTARSVAGSYRVAGTVRNLPDGSVEVMAEGEEREILAFLEAVDERMGLLVESKDIAWSDPTGRHRGFRIIA
jgi:acylphosphatase